MSIQSIQVYRSKVEKIIQYGGSHNESALRKPFQELLDVYAQAKGLLLVPEVEFITPSGKKVYPDGTLKDALRQDWGYWESKDEKDDLEAEIIAKFNKGYPSYNIIFEDTHTAILYQGGVRVQVASFDDAHALDALLASFAGYEPPEVREFHKAIELFSGEVGGLAAALRDIIDEQIAANEAFKTALDEFLELARKAINPKIEMADMREMIIQHLLTEDIFMRVFDEAEFHRDNVIARKLQEVAGTFYKGAVKHNIHTRIAPYYETINAKASQISDHHEKQKFLKALYEKFYQAYNPKAADRLGIVYTPDEIVRFMIESADYLTFQHFGKTLGDKGVEILDPATGTGTFITELIEYLPKTQLPYKYKHEIHCNEVAILPYYIANLNIEYTYKQKMGEYQEFENICFVDTLDNMGFEHTGKQMNFFGITDENAERITRQNSRPIMVVIGNPPYNANQKNENENNKNREYPEIDNRIKETYVKHSTAQKTKLYDMYARFYRWASDRLASHGIVALITNNSYLDSRTFDGFRKMVVDEFSHIYIVDLCGNSRKKESGNVFGIKLGVAIAFLIKSPKKGKTPAQIFYHRANFKRASEKLELLRSIKFSDLQMENIQPDNNHNWLNLHESSWGGALPIASKDIKIERKSVTHKAIFKQYSLGVVTARDEWAYDHDQSKIESKVNFFYELFNKERERWNRSDKKIPINNFVDRTIKWTGELENHIIRGTILKYDNEFITRAINRPFVKMPLYFDRVFIHRTYQLPDIFPIGKKENNLVISFTGTGSEKQFMTLAVNNVPDYHLVGAGAAAQCMPLYTYGNNYERIENITDWALTQFQKHYKDKKISKQDIFHYVYAVLHHPAYRTKYEINLKREFPRIPFYPDFWQWAGWGQRLMDLHLNYETVEPYPLGRIDAVFPSHVKITPRLIAQKDHGKIQVDTETTLINIPPEAWEYRLGTYTALEWILERYKEKTPKDPTIREKFNTYKFADYKDQVIDLLLRVCTVSVETMKIIGEMPEATG